MGGSSSTAAGAAPPRKMLPRKIIMWITFACHCVLSGAFIGLAIASGNNVYNNKDLLTFSSLKVYYNSIMSNIVLGIVVVGLFILFAPFILLNFLWAGGEYPYGFLMGMSFISALFMLLVGLSLQSSDNVTSLFPSSGFTGGVWGSTASNTFASTYAFAYILCGSYCVMTFFIWLCRDVFAPHVIKKPVEAPQAPTGAPQGAIPAGAASGMTVVINQAAASNPSDPVAVVTPPPPAPAPATPVSPTLPPPPAAAENPFSTPGPSNV